MGKRKERRLAAQSAAGRRVKLDLSAEPTGDLNCSSTQDEVGGDTDSKYHAGVPSSPSSSAFWRFSVDQQPENPLLLLGQYSDDELDEDSSRSLNLDNAKNSSAEANNQVDSREGDSSRSKSGEDVAGQMVRPEPETSFLSLEALQNSADNDMKSNDPDDMGKEVVPAELTSRPISSDEQGAGDVSSGWKVVFHEESNRYYYWNIVTGETSWEVPDVLVQGTELTCEQKTASDTEVREGAVLAETGPVLEVELSDPVGTHTTRPDVELQNEGDKSDSKILEQRKGESDGCGSDAKDISNAIDELYHEISALGEYASPRQSGDALMENGSSPVADSEKHTRDKMTHDEDESETDVSSRLVGYCNLLLERLKSLKGSSSHPEVHEKISKLLLEVDIRLLDINCLLSYGPILLPFWKHSERQLEQLESAINNVFFQLGESDVNEVKVTSLMETVSDDIKEDGYERNTVCPVSEKSHASVDVSNITELQKDPHFVASDFRIDRHDTKSSGSDTDEEGEIHEADVPTELTPNTVLHASEDVDMDVDMEIEDGSPAGNTTMVSGAEAFTPVEPSSQPSLPTEHGSFAPEGEFGVPPPPDEEWIPPPPPDNEPVPPPPPDEPPEPSYPPPPSYLETLHPLSYTEQYNLTYPGSNFEYYGQAQTEVPGSDYYAHAGQVALPHPPLYYEAVANSYPGNAPFLVNSVEPVTYYDLQNATVAPQSVVSCAESSVFHSESGNGPLSSDLKSGEAKVEANCTLLTKSEVDAATVYEETQKASVATSFTPITIQASATFSATESVPATSAASVTGVAIAPTSTAVKGQSKVLRSKKRTVAAVPTSRSNKKVSSLVDKWKAAKEELHEDEEDEPENAYEILEKKKQREIEKWRAQQIASGEAKDNANFQPLGGDWRERVKRRRAQLTIEAVQTPPESSNDVKQQPHLNELSRGLPSGWQAYWDESSKQVYYGNSLTSETSWIRPTD